MPRPEPAPVKVPFTLPLGPAAARTLADHDPSAAALLESVLEQIADGVPPADPSPTPHTVLVDPELLQRAQHAATERGTDLADAIDDALSSQPVLLPPVRIARLLGADLSTLARALANDTHAPRPANPNTGGRPLYNALAVCAWWPNRRLRGRPPSHSSADPA